MALLNLKQINQAVALRRKVEKQFAHALLRMIKDMTKLIEDAKGPWQALKLMMKYADSRQFQNYVELCVKRMTTQLAVGQKATWRQAAAESIRGKDIYKQLKAQTANTSLGMAIDAIILQNSDYIKTVPKYVAKYLSKFVYEMQLKGVRPEQITKYIQQKCPQLTAYQCRRIARTESSKAASALMRARCQSMGVQWYAWHSCGDERVRDSHAAMEGILCRWTDPPDPEKLFPRKGAKSSGPYNPGNIYNCRCIALPVIGWQDLNFPVKVHESGRIITIGSVVQWKLRFGQDL